MRGEREEFRRQDRGRVGHRRNPTVVASTPRQTRAHTRPSGEEPSCVLDSSSGDSRGYRVNGREEESSPDRGSEWHDGVEVLLISIDGIPAFGGRCLTNDTLQRFRL